MARPKEKLIYKETYKLGSAHIRTGKEPVLHHITPGWQVDDAYLLAVGRVERDGKEIEFQDMRVYLSKTEVANG